MMNEIIEIKKELIDFSSKNKQKKAEDSVLIEDINKFNLIKNEMFYSILLDNVQ